MARSYPGNSPSRYAAGMLPKMLRWWRGAIGDHIRRMSAVTNPGVPAEAFLGFASNGGENEDTALSPSHARFHELGLFGVSGGKWDIPAPNTDTSAENNWYRLHADPLVRELLGGRDASMSGWSAREGALADQIAIGLVSLLRHGRTAVSSLNASIRPVDPTSLWSIALSFGGWSAGSGGMARHVNQFAGVLAGVPENRRWMALLQEAARRAEAGELRAGSTHNYAVYTFTRTAQKLEAGRALAESAGSGNGAWFGPRDLRAEDILARAASKQATLLSSMTPGGVADAGSEHAEDDEESPVPVWALATAVTLIGGGVGYLVWASRRGGGATEPARPLTLAARANGNRKRRRQHARW